MTATKDVLPTTNTIADYLQVAGGIGQILRGQIPQMLHRQVPAVDPGAPVAVGTLTTITLPDEAKADPSGVLSLYVRAVSGGAVLGYYVQKSTTPFTTPTTGTFSSQPNGNVMLLLADLPTDVDLTYIPQRGKVVTLSSQPVVADSYAIPAALTATPQPNNLPMPGGVVVLLEAFATAGGAVGQKGIQAPNAANPAAGFAVLDLAKQNVLFAVADAVTTCTVKLLVCPDVDLSTILEADSRVM